MLEIWEGVGGPGDRWIHFEETTFPIKKVDRCKWLEPQSQTPLATFVKMFYFQWLLYSMIFSAPNSWSLQFLNTNHQTWIHVAFHGIWPPVLPALQMPRHSLQPWRQPCCGWTYQPHDSWCPTTASLHTNGWIIEINTNSDIGICFSIPCTDTNFLLIKIHWWLLVGMTTPPFSLAFIFHLPSTHSGWRPEKHSYLQSHPPNAQQTTSTRRVRHVTSTSSCFQAAFQL